MNDWKKGLIHMFLFLWEIFENKPGIEKDSQ